MVSEREASGDERREQSDQAADSEGEAARAARWRRGGGGDPAAERACRDARSQLDPKLSGRGLIVEWPNEAHEQGLRADVSFAARQGESQRTRVVVARQLEGAVPAASVAVTACAARTREPCRHDDLNVGRVREPRRDHVYLKVAAWRRRVL